MDSVASQSRREDLDVALLGHDVKIDTEIGQPRDQLVDVAAHTTSIGRQSGRVEDDAHAITLLRSWPQVCHGRTPRRV
jgi:tRNA U54 and U55 pseudouridine synthase Pus10